MTGFIFIILFLCVILPHYSDTTSYISDANLGSSFEFKIYIDGAREECFFQHVEAGASVYVAFQVMRGGDGHAGFSIKQPNGNLVLPYDWKPSAEYEENAAPLTGFYQICIDNSLSHFAGKLVSLYFNSFKRDKWEQYVSELESLGLTVSNFTQILAKVDGDILEMLKYQDHSRKMLTRDWYLVQGNNSYVQYWSIVQCIVIMATGVFQVYFLRKLFESKTLTPTMKPRA